MLHVEAGQLQYLADLVQAILNLPRERFFGAVIAFSCDVQGFSYHDAVCEEAAGPLAVGCDEPLGGSLGACRLSEGECKYGGRENNRSGFGHRSDPRGAIICSRTQ